MKLLAISIDLPAGRKYPALSNHLQLIEAHRVTDSFYVVEMDSSPARLRHDLGRFIGEEDKIVVVEFVGRPSFAKAKAGTTNWIEAHCAQPVA